MKGNKNATTGTTGFREGYGSAVIQKDLQNVQSKASLLPEGKEKATFLDHISKAISVFDKWVPELSGGVPLEA